jgi:hypothetical protein
MPFAGEMDLQALAKLNDIDLSEGDAAAISSRAIDTNGDGRPDLYLVDLDSDGSVNGVVRGLDTNGDGANDTFIQYNEDGSVQSIGRVDPATGELDVVYEEPDEFDKILDSLGLVDLESPEEALFTSFDDPYILDTYGSFGEEVPDVYLDSDMVGDFAVTDVSADEAAAMETGATVDAGAAAEEPAAAADQTSGGQATDASEAEDSSSAPPEVVPKIVEIEDRSGGDASSLWAKVDQDGDGLGDYDTRLEKTSTGTYYGDINKDGYSEDVATDLDMDGRIDTVDTTGRGSSTDTVSAEQVVDPASDYLVDRAPGQDDSLAAGAADEGIVSGADYDAGSSDVGSADSGSVDTGVSDSGSSVDTSSSVDSGGGYDSGSSSSGGDEPV